MSPSAVTLFFKFLLVLVVSFALYAGGTQLASYSRLEALRPPEDPSPLVTESTTLLIRKSVVEVTVPSHMTVFDFERLINMPYPYVRREIAEQIGAPTLPDDYYLPAGKKLTIHLTPPTKENP